MAKIRSGSRRQAAVKKARRAGPAKTKRTGSSARRPSRPAAKAPTRSSARSRTAPPAKPAGRPSARPAPQATPARRSTYADAIILYERGLHALQAKRYRDASDTLRRVIAEFPEEIELHERAELYIRVCERQMSPPDATPKTPDEQVLAATLAMNAGAFDQAVALLTSVLQAQREHDGAEYLLGVALAAKGDASGALLHLARAIDLNTENRDLLRKAPELEALRQTDGGRALLAEASSAARRERRNQPRARR